MKKIILFILLLGATVSLLGQGIVFEQSGWKETLKKAGKEKKMVFVDFYTSWCGPCKEMSKNIMTQPRAGELYNQYFVNFKQDAEKGEGPALAKKYEVTAYPTFIFVNHRGELIYKFLGRRELNEFIAEGQKALKMYKSLPLMAKMGKEYKKGRRDTVFLHEYYDLLKGRGEGEDVLNMYLKALPDPELLKNPYLPEISLYDGELFGRLLAGWKKLDPAKDKKESARLQADIMKALGGCLERVQKQDDENSMEALLAVKKELGNPESAVSQMMGGGIAYMSTPHLRLDFYKQNRKDEKFRILLEEYMEYTIDTISREKTALHEGLKQMTESAKNDPKKMADLKRMKSLLGAVYGLRNKVLSAAISNYTDHYWSISPHQDVSAKVRCEHWLLFAGDLEPTMVGAPAEVLLKLGEKEKAVEMMKKTIRKLESTEDADPKDLEKLRAQLENIK